MLFLASAGGRTSCYGHFIQLTKLSGYWRLSRLFGEKKRLHILRGITYLVIFFCVYLGVRILERYTIFPKILGANSKFYVSVF
jgi:hypothetical protein